MADASAFVELEKLRNQPLQSPAPIAPGTPVMSQWEPRYVTDNIAPMVTDAAGAVGVPDRIANRLGKETAFVAGFTPPGAALDAAGDIGGAVHRGDTKDAILKAGMWNLARQIAGPVMRGVSAFVPTQGRRDAMQAAYRETLPGSSVGMPHETSAWLGVLPGSREPLRDVGIENFRRFNFGADRMYPAPGNVNSRGDMRSRLFAVE